MTPPLREFHWETTHRLIPSRYSESNILGEIVESEAMLREVVLLAAATDERTQGEQQGLGGISPYELVYGIAHAQIVSAAFTHTSDTGSRFNDGTRGAWYAAGELETSVTEVSYHKARRLGEIVVPELPYGRPDKEISTYDNWLADFRSQFHFLDPADQFAECLQPEPVPQCYLASQRLARQLLLHERSNGIVYPSVRRAGYRCVACFRPALVSHLRRGERLQITFTANPAGYAHEVERVAEDALRPF